MYNFTDGSAYSTNLHYLQCQEDDGGDREERRRYEQEAEQERRERLLKLADSTGPSKEDLARWRDEYRENVVEKKVTVLVLSVLGKKEMLTKML